MCCEELRNNHSGFGVRGHGAAVHFLRGLRRSEWWLLTERALDLLRKHAGAEVGAMWRADKSARHTELEGPAPDHTGGSAWGNTGK